MYEAARPSNAHATVEVNYIAFDLAPPPRAPLLPAPPPSCNTRRRRSPLSNSGGAVLVNYRFAPSSRGEPDRQGFLSWMRTQARGGGTMV